MNRERLLNVARALRESPAPGRFTMAAYAHACGTPACALAHYTVRQDLQSAFEIGRYPYGSGMLCVRDTTRCASFDGNVVTSHFAIDQDTAELLFGERGCGNATTADDAAQFIEEFVGSAE